MSIKPNGAIVTYSGEIIKPLDPDPASINIMDIAHALSNNCRFTGHTKEFYSVAQHSVLVSNNVPDDQALTGLLHDASEAYLSDFARPIKQMPEFGEYYRDIENTLMEAIAITFGITWPMPEEVKKADSILLRTEQRDLMPPLLREESDGDEYLEAKIIPVLPEEAERRFLKQYYELTSTPIHII